MEEILDFLRRHQMHPDCMDQSACCTAFFQEMKNGLDGVPSSLMMLSTYLRPATLQPDSAPILVLDAGGTNLRVALLDSRAQKIITQETVSMPGTGGSISWDAFLHALCDIAAPFAQSASRLGFCFSFPAEITKEIDGKILSFNKEVQIAGAQGHLMCRELVSLLNREYHCSLRSYALLNDTTATLLGGFSSLCSEHYDGFVGMILGTGLNCCYVEPETGMIVNMEAGGYSGYPQGTFDRVLDQSSANPGEHLFEKMVSGGYLGSVIHTVLLGACQEGLFSEEFHTSLQNAVVSTEQVSKYLENPLGESLLSSACHSDSDRLRLWTVVDCCLERAAIMVAIMLSAILVKADCGRMPWRPACVIVEGSTFHKCTQLRKKIEYHIHDFTENRCRRYLRFVSADQPNLWGAAAAALLKV